MLESKSPIIMGEYQTLGIKAFWLSLAERLSPSFGFLVIAVAITIALRLSMVPVEIESMVSLAGIVLYALFFISLVIGTVWSWFVYTNHMFALDDDAFKIKHGILTKVEIAFPYRQIQNVEIERRLLFRFFGLSRLMIITAGNDNPKTERNEAEAVLPVVDREIAVELQEELLRRTDVQRMIKTK